MPTKKMPCYRTFCSPGTWIITTGSLGNKKQSYFVRFLSGRAGNFIFMNEKRILCPLVNKFLVKIDFLRGSAPTSPVTSPYFANISKEIAIVGWIDYKNPVTRFSGVVFPLGIFEGGIWIGNIIVHILLQIDSKQFSLNFLYHWLFDITSKVKANPNLILCLFIFLALTICRTPNFCVSQRNNIQKTNTTFLA